MEKLAEEHFKCLKESIGEEWSGLSTVALLLELAGMIVDAGSEKLRDGDMDARDARCYAKGLEAALTLIWATAAGVANGEDETSSVRQFFDGLTRKSN